jgi:hypothetical protein
VCFVPLTKKVVGVFVFSCALQLFPLTKSVCVKDVSFINNCIRLSKADHICHVISTTLKGGSNNLESFIIKQLVDNKKLMKINIK